MKKSILLILFVFAYSHIQAQFDNTVEALSETITNVQSSKKEINQSIDSTSPGVLSVTIEEVSTKGKTTTKNYIFNAGDIDHHTVKAITKKDVITVQLFTNQKQKLIKQIVNNEKTSYINKFVIFAEDIDNARDLVGKIKATIAPAKKLTEERLSLTNYNDRLDWLIENIGDVNGTKKEFAQNIEKQANYKGSVTLNRTVNSGKSAKVYRYDFNLATINPNRIMFKVDGEFFNILVETKRKNKTIKVSQDGVQKSYINKLNITCKNIEQARDIQKVLKEIIPLAEKKFNASIKPISSISQGVEKLNDLIATIESNKTTITQNFEGNCIQTFDQEEITGKKTKHNIYNFNLVDLNKNKVNYASKGLFIVIELTTNAKNKFIKYTSNDELKSYTDKFKIYFPKVEDAIVAQKILIKMIELSISDKENQFVKSNKSSMIQKLQETVDEVAIGDKTFQQELNIKEDNKVLEFKNTIITKKSSTEKLYEVNLSDLKAKTVKINTSGKNVIVVVKTVHLEKIIKYYENGTTKSYQNKIEIHATDIENARKIANLLRAIIE